MGKEEDMATIRPEGIKIITKGRDWVAGLGAGIRTWDLPHRKLNCRPTTLAVR